MPLTKKHLLKLALISVAAIVIGALVGLVLNYQTLKNLRSNERVPIPPPDPPIKRREEKIATYSGKIKPSIQPKIAAHYLEDDDGNLIIFLKSGKIESGFLGILEGQMVEVVGTVEDLPAGRQDGQEVLKVDEVHL